MNGCTRRQKRATEKAVGQFVNGRWQSSVVQVTVPATSGVLTGELRWRLVTFETVASVGHLAPAAVLVATRCDDDRDRRSPRLPRDDACEMGVKNQAVGAVCYRPEDVITCCEMSYCLLLQECCFWLAPIFNVGLCILSLWLLFLSVLIACILSEFILKIPGFYL